MIKSIQDWSSPLVNVCWAGGAGSRPLRTYQSYYSHVYISHGALWLTLKSILLLGISVSPILGYCWPMRVFQSPQTTALAPAGMDPVISSMRLRATSSSVPRFYIFYTGGKYTLPTHAVSPPYSWIHTPCAYSFPMYLRILMPFLISIAIPPLWPFSLRSSYTWYPGISSLTLHCAIQVSYRQRMSSVCVSKSMYNLNKLIPAILIFPTLIPCCFQRLCLVSVAFLLLIEPFVRFCLDF